MAEKKLSPAERFKVMLDSAKQQDSYYVDAAKVELSEQIYVAMDEKGVSGSELSRRLQVSRAYVNKILQGKANLTIESLVKIGRALDCEFKFAFGPLEEKIEDVLDTEYIYETEEAGKMEVNSDPQRNKHHNVLDFTQYKLSVSKDLSAVIDRKIENARSEFAA